MANVLNWFEIPVLDFDRALISLNGGNDLSVPIYRVEPVGGKILLPKTKITDEFGYFALFLDTEGNKIFFHSLT